MSENKQVKVGGLLIGCGAPISVQTMCNTHTYDEDATINQCVAMAEAGADVIRITCPTKDDVAHIRVIHDALRERGVTVPVVADIHFSSEAAIAVAPYVEKVRINPGNFNPDHRKACQQFRRLIGVCRQTGTAIRIGLNHGSLGKYITDLYGNTPEAMAKAAMEWINICIDEHFDNTVISLKASNTVVMVEAYRCLSRMMHDCGTVYPLHVGVTEAGNGDEGRIKSCVGISTLLSEGIGDTLRVSLTEDPVNEISVGKYLADRYMGKITSTITSVDVQGKTAVAIYEEPLSKERLLLDFSCDFGSRLLGREIDSVILHSPYGKEYDEYLVDELMQASRRRFYKPEYIACPGCGRTMYDLQKAFEEVKSRTSHLRNTVIAVMGCIVNGPGEMADADWGYVGEGNHKVSIYRRGKCVRTHIPDTDAVDVLLELIGVARTF